MLSLGDDRVIVNVLMQLNVLMQEARMLRPRLNLSSAVDPERQVLKLAWKPKLSGESPASGATLLTTKCVHAWWAIGSTCAWPSRWDALWTETARHHTLCPELACLIESTEPLCISK